METNVTKLSGKIALVTGASSGIGEETAQRLATAGYKVYGTSRRGARSGLVARLERNAALNPVDMSTFYTPRPKDGWNPLRVRRPINLRRKSCLEAT
jgi:NAD(P)-dependent dehydrogenase (short-subunit alcohol dehydrogenase family)